MIKLRRIKELINFLDRKTKTILVILTVFLFSSAIQIILGFVFLGVPYIFEGVIIFFASLYGMIFLFKISEGIYLSSKTIKKITDHYYPFSSIDEISQFMLKNFYIFSKEIKSLREFNSKLMDLINQIDEVGIVIIDSDKNIINYNKFVEKVFNISQDCRGKKFYSIFSLFAPRIDEIKHGESKDIEILDGDTVKTIRVKLINIGDIVITYFFDITHLKNLERLNELSISIFSHELKTPLTNLSLVLENILLSKEFSESIINIALSNITRISNTISNITSLSNIYSNTISITPTCFNLKDLVEKLIKEVSIFYNDKNLTIDFSYEGVEDIVEDSEKIYLILFNLIDNAMKFSPKGERVLIKVNNTDKLNISISNKVYNLSEEDVARMFERFYRGKNSVGLRGSGLGLYIVKLLCNFMGLKIEAKLDSNTITFFIHKEVYYES